MCSLPFFNKQQQSEEILGIVVVPSSFSPVHRAGGNLARTLTNGQIYYLASVKFPELHLIQVAFVCCSSSLKPEGLGQSLRFTLQPAHSSLLPGVNGLSPFIRRLKACFDFLASYFAEMSGYLFFFSFWEHMPRLL